jgi:ankyrin repeat protein
MSNSLTKKLTIARINALFPDVRDENDFILLHNAAWEGILEMVKLLLNASADIQASNRIEDTPLSRALDNNRTEVVEYIRTRLQ